MTVFKHPNGQVYHYDFWYRGDRFTGNTQQTTKGEAEIVEAGLKKKLRLQAGGIAPPEPAASPRFQDWAEVYLDHVIKRRADIKRSERIELLLRVVLRFWGQQPAPEVTGPNAAKPGEPYHNLRLADPIADPMWLMKFEDWMAAKDLAGQTKNHYRSALSQMYALALQPAFRKRTGVAMNPFIGLPRDRGTERTSTVSVDELRAWLSHASYHIRLALSIAALAPKLRLANVLALRWDRHVDRAKRLITVAEHKTAGRTGKPLVIAYGDQLAMILDDARKRFPRAKHVITYQGRRVKKISDGLRAAAEGAKLTWGRFAADGVTFHTIRHTMATMLAELADLDGGVPLSESIRKEVMGHERLETTQRYTHIRPTIERAAQERLSKVTPIVDIVTRRELRASRKTKKKARKSRRTTTGKSTGTRDFHRRKIRVKSHKSALRVRPAKKRL